MLQNKLGRNRFRNRTQKFGGIRAGQNLPSISGKPRTPEGTGRLRSRGPQVLGGGAYEDTPLEAFLRAWVSSGTTSESEGFIYFALEKLLGPEGVQWVYQESRLGGRHRLGGAVVDFIIYLAGLSVGVRVQTYRFHMNVSPSQQAYDKNQLIALSDPSTMIIDVFEQQYIQDRTGQAAIRLMLEIINRQWRPNPLGTGMVVGTG